MRGGYRHDIQSAFNQTAHVRQNAVAVQFAKRVARGRHRRAAKQAELGVAGGFELGIPLLGDALDVAHGEKPAQMVLLVHDEQLVYARMVGEEFVRPGDGIAAEFLLINGMDLGARGEGVGDFAFGVAWFDDVAGQQADQFAPAVHYRECAEGKLPLFDQTQDVTDHLVRRHFDRVLNQSMDVVLYAADFRELLAFGHVVVDQPQPAVQRHGNSHPRLGDRIHVRRDHRNVELQPLGQRCVELRVARQDLGITGGQRDVVVSQSEMAVG